MIATFCAIWSTFIYRNDLDVHVAAGDSPETLDRHDTVTGQETSHVASQVTGHVAKENRHLDDSGDRTAARCEDTTVPPGHATPTQNPHESTHLRVSAATSSTPSTHPLSTISALSSFPPAMPATTKPKTGILERLAAGPVIGDGSYVMILEKRGYCLAGPYTPEAVMENPEAVTQLHKDYIRAGADIVQAFTFYSTDDKLKSSSSGVSFKCTDISQAACNIAKEVSAGGDTLICGGVSPTLLFQNGGSKEEVQAEFKKMTDAFKGSGTPNVDFVLAEFFPTIEEIEWAIEVLKELNLPVAATMRIGSTGDLNDNLPAACAVRMARAGADIVGVQCNFDPFITFPVIEQMKQGLEKEGLTPYLMMQPCCYHCPETDNMKEGYMTLPEYPLALEPRTLTRFDCHKYARKAFDLGVRYIGGCCGFEPYHIRALAEELSAERGVRPPGAAQNCLWGDKLAENFSNRTKRKASRGYWETLEPASGRLDSMPLSIPMVD